MATYINPNAIEDGTISASKLDETIATKSYVDNQIKVTNDKVNDFKNAGYLYAGIATPTTDPGSPKTKVFYIANGKGTYEKFDGINVTEDEVVILYYDTTWHKVSTGIASQEKLSELKTILYGDELIVQPTEVDIYIQHINSIGKWAKSTSAIALIKVDNIRGREIKVTNYKTGGRCGFAIDANLNGDAPIYCADSSFFVFEGNNLLVPNDANFLIFSLNTSRELPVVELVNALGVGLVEEVKGKQEKLISGENIKTLNGESILGNGDISLNSGDTNRYVQSWNLLNPSEIEEGFISNTTGLISASDTYKTSGFIAVKEGQRIVFSYSTTSQAMNMNVRFIAAFDEGKNILSDKGSSINVIYYIVPKGVSFIRYSWLKNSYSTNIMCEVSENGNPSYYIDYGVQNIPKVPYAFLPKYVYVTVGRTVEIYNKQVCLSYHRYHFRWICSNGNAYSRKFSITGKSNLTTTRSDSSLELGQHRLTLCLYDDNNQLVWAGQTILVFKELSNGGSILPIGDSLTNWKRWLPEIMYLSNKRISFIGTRYSGIDYDSKGNTYNEGEIHHEGRSGWSASHYLTNATYNFDTKYDGVPEVDGSSNPFWDGTKFSLTYYLTTQQKEVPNAVQIFLGTNDLGTSVESAVQNILNLVSIIRQEYPTMPIFVCNTIYRSSQDGYVSIGNDGYATSNGVSLYEYREDCKVFELMRNLCKELIDEEYVYIIPLAICHDTEYNFGQVNVKANPRAEQEVVIPTESVHPQTQGYYQFADVMFSAYSAVL